MPNLTDEPQILSQQHEPLDVRAYICDLESCAVGGEEWESARQRCLFGAASAQSTATIVHSREQSLLQGVGDMSTTREPPSAPCAGEQLERCLAVAVFEVLTWKAMAVDCEQQLPT